MRENNRNSIEKCRKKLPQFTTMNVIDGQAGLVNYSSLIFYSLTIDNILNIIVLLILAGVSIATLTGENGILTQATKADEKTVHGDVREQLQLNVNEYSIDKNTEGSSSTLIEYLQSKQIIGNEIGEDTGNYQIDVTKLLGKAQKYGNGAATESEKKDVYMIEKQDESDGKVIYKVIYYKNGTSDNEELGELTDLTDVSNDEITFRIENFLITRRDNEHFGEYYDIEIMKDFRAKKGMTWRRMDFV